MAAHARAGSLDRALIAGANPARSPQLAARAALLTAPRTRALIAGGLGRARAGRAGAARALVGGRSRRPLLASAPSCSSWQALLRGDAPLDARGVAMLDELLTDGTGPAYHGERDQLARVLREARAALAG